MQQRALKKNQFCKFDLCEQSILRATLPSTGKQRHSMKKAECQFSIASHLSSLQLVSSLMSLLTSYLDKPRRAKEEIEEY